MRFADRMRQGAFRWLSRQLAIAEGKAPDPRACVLGPGAALYPEAEIHNFSGRRDDIAVGAHSHMRGRLLTYGHGGRIRVGEWCYICVRTEICSMQSVTIGDRVLIAHGVNIHDGTAHSLDAGERHRHFRHIVERGHPTQWSELPGIEAAPVTIEDDVWICGFTTKQGHCCNQRSALQLKVLVDYCLLLFTYQQRNMARRLPAFD